MLFFCYLRLSNHEVTGVSEEVKWGSRGQEPSKENPWAEQNRAQQCQQHALSLLSQHTAGSGQSWHRGLTCCSPTNDLTTYFFRSSALGVSSAASLNTFKLWV